MRLAATPAVTVRILAITAAIGLAGAGVATAQSPHPDPDPYKSRDPFADVPPVTVMAQGRTIQARFLGGSWTTPAGQPVASAPPCCLRLGPHQTLPVRSRAWFDVVLRENVSRVRVFTLHHDAVTFLRVLPDPLARSGSASPAPRRSEGDRRRSDLHARSRALPLPHGAEAPKRLVSPVAPFAGAHPSRSGRADRGDLLGTPS